MSTGVVVNSNLLANLNAQQAEAVSLGWGPSLIIAGAGSGKTTVLTRRIVFLMTELHQEAESILAVTFTNKAAGEMKSRIEKLVGFHVARRLTIGTFHSVCARILRQEIDEYVSPEGWRWQKNFVIYDETDTLNLVKAAIQRLNLDEKVFIPRSIRYEISALKNDGISSSKYASIAKTYKEQRLSEIYSQFQAGLARNNAFDFDDLILVFSELLKSNAAVLERQRQRFRHVLVDEFQDTNKSQYDLISLLAGPSANAGCNTLADDWSERSLVVVGDVDQSIYSWRKADFRIILGFQNDYKSAKLIKLEENYRSTNNILEIANSIILNNTERVDKVLRCNRGKGAKAQCYEAQDEIDEAYYVVEELKRLKERGKTLNDCVILYRTNAQSRAIEEVLVRNHMPYVLVGGQIFYERQEIKDVIAYLKLIYNAKDGQAFNRVVNVPKRGLGKTTLEKVESFADQNNLSMLEAAASATQIKDISPKAAKGLSDFADLVVRWQNAAAVSPVSELIELFLKDIQYIGKLEEDANSSKDELALGRIENVREFVNVAKEFESVADEPDLDSFLTRISLVSDLDAVKADQDTVKLMTLHSAKGLEYAVVFLMGLEEGLFPHVRSLESESALEEERRLMYVGVTRAADLLYLTLSRKRMLMGRGSGSGFSSSYTIPSRFLKEITPGLLSGYYPSATLNNSKSDEFEDGATYGAQSSGYGGNKSGHGGNSSGYGGNSSGYGGNSSGYGGNSSGYGGNSSGGKNNYGGGGQSGYAGGGSKYGSTGSASNDRPRAMRQGSPDNSRISSSNSFREQEAMRPPSAPVSFERLSVGDTVQHVKFGTGKVVKVIGEKDKELYNVQFEGDAGNRLLDPKFAKLIKLS